MAETTSNLTEIVAWILGPDWGRKDSQEQEHLLLRALLTDDAARCTFLTASSLSLLQKNDLPFALECLLDGLWTFYERREAERDAACGCGCRETEQTTGREVSPRPPDGGYIYEPANGWSR